MRNMGKNILFINNISSSEYTSSSEDEQAGETYSEVVLPSPPL